MTMNQRVNKRALSQYSGTQHNKAKADIQSEYIALFTQNARPVLWRVSTASADK